MIRLAAIVALSVVVAAQAASEPQHVRVARWRCPPEPFVIEPVEKTEPPTWQQQWLAERAAAIQMRCFPADLPE